jgi:hypothetical protein
MRIEDFTVFFKKQQPILFSFLLKLIRGNQNFKGDRLLFVKGLISLIYYEAYLKVLQGGLSKLPVEAIIMRKAKDVYYEALRTPKKAIKFKDLPPDVEDFTCTDPDPYQRMVLREEMQAVTSLLDDASLELFENIADKVSSRVIASKLEITMTALTTLIYRERKLIREKYRKDF